MKNAAELFKIFCVDKRIEIIEYLKKGSMCVNSLANSLKISPSAVSQHLRILKSAGLVEDERRGYFICYSLKKQALEKANKILNQICTCGCLSRIKKKE